MKFLPVMALEVLFFRSLKLVYESRSLFRWYQKLSSSQMLIPARNLEPLMDIAREETVIKINHYHDAMGSKVIDVGISGNKLLIQQRGYGSFYMFPCIIFVR